MTGEDRHTPPAPPQSALSPIEWAGRRISRLVLGTAQLGMDYGIANAAGKPDPQQAAELLQHAWDNGIQCYDTAQAYGDSESVLGAWLNGRAGALVVTKLAPDTAIHDPSETALALDGSLTRLRVPALWGLLLHRPSMLDHWDEALGDTLRRARSAGAIRHLGVSVYAEEEAERTLEMPDLELIQLPCNAWDQTVWRSGLLQRLRDAGKLVFVRSVLLQGILAMAPDAVARKLPAAAEAAQRWHELADAWNTTPLVLAIRFGLLLDVPLVVGAEQPAQISEIVEAAEQGPLSVEEADAIHAMIRRLEMKTHVTNPTLWWKP